MQLYFTLSLQLINQYFLSLELLSCIEKLTLIQSQICNVSIYFFDYISRWYNTVFTFISVLSFSSIYCSQFPFFSLEKWRLGFFSFSYFLSLFFSWISPLLSQVFISLYCSLALSFYKYFNNNTFIFFIYMLNCDSFDLMMYISLRFCSVNGPCACLVKVFALPWNLKWNGSFTWKVQIYIIGYWFNFLTRTIKYFWSEFTNLRFSEQTKTRTKCAFKVPPCVRKRKFC